MSREVNMTNDPQWYERMGRAMKKRDHALSMMSRWEETRTDAEAEIQALTNSEPAPVSAPEE